MANPIKLTASLPMLGLCDAVLHAESAEVLRMFGEMKELARLRKVPHLGVASSTVTGINHSRLEYALLQCSIISIVAKQFKNSSAVALSSGVRIPGQKTEVSSGEELLKAWSILGNVGHLQNTYAEERAYLLASRDDKGIRAWLSDSSRSRQTRQWIKGVLDGGRDDQLHYVFCYRRIAYLPKHDRRKAPAERLLSALLHPIDELYRGDSSAKFKLIRLRHLFSTIRLLSMLAIDSYYSAQPLRFQIAQSVLGLPDLMRSMSNEGTNIGNLLKQTAAWLADALYLAPEVTTLRSAHELRVAAEIKKRAKGPSKAKALRKLLDRSLWHGVTPVEKRGFRHLVRLTLRGAYQKRLLPEDKFLATAAIHRDVICGDSALASVDTNSFSGDSHIDLMVQGSSPTADNWGLLSRLITWAIKAIEVQALNELRRLVPGAVRADKKATKTVSTRFLTRLVRRHLSLVPQLFRAVMKELLPPGWSVEIEREGLLSEDSRTIRLRASLSIGVQIDELGEELTRQIEDNPHALSPAALQELVATRSALDRSPSKFIIGCVGKIVIKDQLGKHRDEVDGLFVEVDGDSIRVRMVEAKTGGTYQERETSAMNQLAATRSWVRRRKGLSCARRRLPRMGAMMIVSAVRSESTSK